ncbi:hypothetical protein [Streptomyces sp. TBY4]|uniref:hypothetical protein n=1 Tax=Streptomyces sp. TBY4 TaxID=2962030 RepID=UPI0020B81282|nr:hypothetical protein [Streptomyces sp. TBY4]MCP3759106.1 hypothetical protein [Streptomyces sp. TBY4]
MYGRSEEEWAKLTEAGLEFLLERARQNRPTSYTELNATLVQRVDTSGFDFSRADERAAMGHLLWLIVERNRPESGLMLSALVFYLNSNEAGPGFFGLAQELGQLSAKASRRQKEEFWVDQLRQLEERYSHTHP